MSFTEAECRRRSAIAESGPLPARIRAAAWLYAYEWVLVWRALAGRKLDG